MLAEERLGNKVRKCMLELVCPLLKLTARAELMPYFPPPPSLLWITSYYLLQGKSQWNVFSSSSPKFSPCCKH